MEKKVKKKMEENPENELQAMTDCNIEIYPTVFKQILATILVCTSSKHKRIFSYTKRIKTYLRNTMTEINKKLLYQTFKKH